MLERGDFDYVRKLLRERSGIVLEDGKEYLVETRLASIVRRDGLTGVPDVIRRLRNDPDLSTEVVEALTTNETSFFRDARVYDALRESFLPELIERNASARKLRIWSAACSTGQEPYSLAMMLHDDFPKTRDWDVQITATDLDKQVLERARAGRYSKLEVGRGLTPEQRRAHFEEDGHEFVCKPYLRKRIHLEQINLVKPWSLKGPFDLVLIRNVLIYFDLATKRDVLERIRRMMAPHAVLVLGGAETTLNVHQGYARVPHGNVAFYRPG